MGLLIGVVWWYEGGLRPDDQATRRKLNCEPLVLYCCASDLTADVPLLWFSWISMSREMLKKGAVTLKVRAVQP